MISPFGGCFEHQYCDSLSSLRYLRTKLMHCLAIILEVGLMLSRVVDFYG